jgi:hypothetical protein
MTALALSAIPSNINTYERLLLWTAQAISSAANGLTVNVAVGEAQQPFCSVNTAVLANDKTHWIVNAYIEFNVGDLNDPDEKTWMSAQDIVTATPHVNFSTN